MCNFLPYKGKVYGYVHPSRGGQIKIERLRASKDDLSISNITVVWTAKHPQAGRVVVGWYEDAIVHRESQKFRASFPQKKKHQIEDYRIETLKNSAKLLPIDQRTLNVPRGKGGMGQSNVWYPDKLNHQRFFEKVKRLIRGKKKRSKRKQLHKTDPEKKAQVEKAAIKTTTRHFENIGYTVKSVEKDNVGWDLEATKKKRTLLIEVKGLSGGGAICWADSKRISLSGRKRR